MSIIGTPEDIPLGSPLPPGDLHAVSVALPKWADTEGWASRQPRILEALQVGYPRFMIPRVVETLVGMLLEELALQTEFPTAGIRAIILCSHRHALMCREYLCRDSGSAVGSGTISIFSVSWSGRIAVDVTRSALPNEDVEVGPGMEDLFVVCFPEDHYTTAKSFWQHTGFGISSRRAARWVELGPFSRGTAAPTMQHNSLLDPVSIQFAVDEARASMKRLISANQSSSGEIKIDEKDVFLYPSGMAGITEVAAAIQALRGRGEKRICTAAVFGFLYVDTYKVLTRVLGYDATLYKFDDSEIDVLEAKLDSGFALDALFTEFPGNPLLQSPNLERLSILSKKHGFVLAVDDTIGSCANVNVLSTCDVVCTSLTKMFSGTSNVMGGSVALSPASPFHDQLHKLLLATQRDNKWFPEDILLMESNSRDFVTRTRRASANASAVAAQLRAHPDVVTVYYPQGSLTQSTYDRSKLPEGGYGFMLSIRFACPEKAVAFHDALDVAKGPSLGTNFTLACPYTLLAHYRELEWAAEYGVVEDLVRISVGLEDREWLRLRVARALQAAGDEGCMARRGP
ncbi:putative cystathionine gamma-synthase/beta-lyase [Podospora aff. communis PSN243]|uniref:Cystathionine gamma-synthase/beta-lyase n=1 Tax=Podospora aff. communis PSN243 TaxID=3040156 RepID=A0AAV9GCH6_9PEZI|nr:putative cystathionine gamma-synthase/beta-lyase [Podospora aff. communis PSN243]